MNTLVDDGVKEISRRCPVGVSPAYLNLLTLAKQKINVGPCPANFA